MKTSELKRIVEENGYEFKMNANGIDVFINAPLGIYFYTQDGNSVSLGARYRIKHHKAITITKALLDYIQTPLNEREDEKKYNLKYNDTCFDFMDSWLVQESSGKFWFSVYIKGKFTQQEIDNFPQEIRGAIECGFLKKVDVE